MCCQLRAHAVGVVAFVCLLFTSTAFAVSARPGLITFKQPDGTTVKGELQGDEFFSWYRAADGRIFVRNPVSQAFEYAQLTVVNGQRRLQPSGIRVGSGFTSFSVPEHNLWEMAKNRRALLGMNFPTRPKTLGLFKLGGDTGRMGIASLGASATRDFKTLVVLIEFSDYRFNSPISAWSAKIFGDQPGQLNDYYREISNGQVRFMPAAESNGTANDGFVRITLNEPHPHPRRDFGAAAALFERVLAVADPAIDFASFDTDRNGEVSRDELQLLFVVAGPDSSTNGETAGVWGHSSHLSEMAIYDGVRVGGGSSGAYAAIGERHDDHDATLGIIAHELGHAAFQLPDLYPDLGQWDLMSSGSWGFRPDQPWQGMSPVHMTAWSKWRAGFLEPTYVDPMYAAATHTLRRPLSGAQNTLILPTQDGYFAFLLEHRRLEGYDRGLEPWTGADTTGKSGLLVGSSYSSYMLRANNGDAGSTSITNLYYPGNVTRVGPDTAPSTSNPYSGRATQFAFENIAYSGDEMTVSVRRAGQCQAYTATNSAHVTAGRAYTVVTGTWFKTTTWYANGSNQSLGTSGTTSTTLREESPGYFVKGSCPTQAAPAITSITNNTSVKQLEGAATDADDDIVRIELEFDGDGRWTRADTRLSDVAKERVFYLSYAGLAPGTHTARTRAIDAGGRLSAVNGPFSFTVLGPRAPTCTLERVHRDAEGYWMAAGFGEDADNDLRRVEIRLDGGVWKPAVLDYVSHFTARVSDAPHGTAGALPNGRHTVEARAWDASGLSGACGPFTFDVGVEHAPTVGAVSTRVFDAQVDVWGEAADIDADATGIELEFDGNGQWVLADSFYLDGQNPTLANYSHTRANVAVGNHSVRARAVDAGGRRSAASAAVSFTIAAPAAPTCTIDSVTFDSEGRPVASGTAADVNGDLVGLETLVIGTTDQWWPVWDAANWVQVISENKLAPGTYQAKARARDSRGNVGTCVKTFTVAGAACFTAKNLDHIAATRAYKCGSTWLPQACATGSAQNLGGASTYNNPITSLKEQSAGYWVKVASCP